MSLLPQLESELIAAAHRPVLAKRVPVRVVCALLAALLVLLILAPQSTARRPEPAIAALTTLGL
jgi:hypothetical protein